MPEDPRLQLGEKLFSFRLGSLRTHSTFLISFTQPTMSPTLKIFEASHSLPLHHLFWYSQRHHTFSALKLPAQ